METQNTVKFSSQSRLRANSMPIIRHWVSMLCEVSYFGDRDSSYDKENYASKKPATKSYLIGRGWQRCRGFFRDSDPNRIKYFSHNYYPFI